MAAWPGTLPQYVDQSSYAEQPPNVTIRSEMDAGAAKLRRRFTTGPRMFNVAVQLDSTQLSTLDTFYVSTLEHGSLPFDWVHPITRAAAEFRFTAPPSYRAVSGLVFEVSLPLELLP